MMFLHLATAVMLILELQTPVQTKVRLLLRVKYIDLSQLDFIAALDGLKDLHLAHLAFLGGRILDLIQTLDLE